MGSFIEYEAKVRWGRFIDVAPEVWERFVNEINLFHPIAPIQTTNSEFFFSVKEEKDISYISIKTEVDRTNFGDKPIESFGNLLDETIVRRLKDFFFAINLAYPGHLHVFNSFLYRYGVPVCSFSYSTGTSGMAYERCRWLPFEDLTIKQCWDWLTTKTSFLSYISRTPIDRALFALTYESVANDDLDIFYVLLGIEALYNDGSNREESISAQLKRKVQAVLGPLPQAALSEMNKMYGVRSALVHGAADIFKCWPSEEYSMTEYEKIGKDRDHILIATGILLASIQKFIKANANELIETTTVELK